MVTSQMSPKTMPFIQERKRHQLPETPQRCSEWRKALGCSTPGFPGEIPPVSLLRALLLDPARDGTLGYWGYCSSSGEDRHWEVTWNRFVGDPVSSWERTAQGCLYICFFKDKILPLKLKGKKNDAAETRKKISSKTNTQTSN